MIRLRNWGRAALPVKNWTKRAWVERRMVKDPGVKLLRRWVRDEMAVPSLPQLREVVGKIHQVPALSSRTVEVGGEGATHWLPEGSSSVGMGGTSFPGPKVRTKRGMVK